MKKSLLSLTLLALASFGIAGCTDTPALYGESGTTWIIEGGERPTGHIGSEEEESDVSLSVDSDEIIFSGVDNPSTDIELDPTETF